MLPRMPKAWVRRALFAAAAACIAVPAGGVEVTTLPPPTGAGIERGVAVLRCSTNVRGVYWESRGAVLDVGVDRHADVVLTTRHGLPGAAEAVLSDCRAIARGKPYWVEALWRSPAIEDDWQNDWAVLLTRALGDNIRRLRPGLMTPTALARLLAEQAPVRLVLRYGDETQSDCHLEQSESTQTPVLLNSCISHPGLSGTPLIAMIAGQPIVIATLVGSRLDWDGARFTSGSLARALDSEVAAAIEAAVDRARTARHQVR
jgi:hypothetical protein